MSNVKCQILEGKTPKFFTPSPTTLKTATKVYVNLGEPELAKEIAQRNVDGVGLLRAEFMIAQIGVHPKKIINDTLLHPRRLRRHPLPEVWPFSEQERENFQNPPPARPKEQKENIFHCGD
jgi:phosphoenolpyruvate synthase (EC 2.7.9.2)